MTLNIRIVLLTFPYLNASSGGFLCVHNDRLHIFAQDFGDGNIVSFMSRLTHVYHSIIL